MGLKDYFAFNKRQRNGIIVLLTLILGMMIYLIISDYLPPSPASVDFSSFKADMAKVKFKQTDTATKQAIAEPTIQTDKPVRTTPLELNSADSADFMEFPSVSPKVARTIVRFRNALGGYYSKEQLLEVYGLDDACYNSIADKITLDISKVERLDVNKATEKELTHHPYIHKKLAKAIVGYRRENGHFTRLSDIMKVDGIDGDLYEKLSHYLIISN